jgi:YVTN family beta-propeller protein
VRGYTVFTQERGDEAAARLARRFATIAREAVDARGGEVIELRGDEALAVFVSARQAIRAAVDLQQRFVEETQHDPSLPLPVGIGLDAGEAVRMEGGYRGGALNLAARLCGHAGAGEILASREVVHLARKIEGVRFGDTLDLTLKGLSDPVRAVKVLPEDGDPAVILGPFAPARPAPEPPARPSFPRSLVSSTPRLVALIVALALVALAIPLAARRLGPPPVEIGERPVGMLDLPSGRVTAAIDTGDAPTAVAFGEGAVWVAGTGGTVSRIDPEQRRVVQEIPVPQDPAGVAVGEGGVWVTSARERTVSRINPASNTVVKRIEVGNGPSGIAVGGGGVWVANTFDNVVVRIDPGTDEVADIYPVTGSPSGIAFGFDAAWVANETEATVSRIDPASGTVTPINVGNGPRHVLAAAGGVWVANRLDGTVTKIDPTTNRVAFTLPAGDAPAGIAADGGGVWVASELGASVKRIEADGTEGETVDVGTAVLGLALVQDSLWFTSRGAPTSRRGGTLTLVSALETTSVDPSLAPSPLHSVVGDGLVGHKRIGGVDGTTLVPGLAVAVPNPTDAGRTYTFRLRPGIRYSSDEPVVATDFRRAIERVFRLEGFDAPIYGKIVGADACMARPATCDLSDGIQADDEAGTITFSMSAPDPVLLHTLAAPTSYPIPEGTPDEDVGTDAVPGTGPYEITSFVPRERIVLERNPQFRPWPHRPDGFADQIVVRDGVPPEDLVAEVLEDRADGVLSPPLIPPDQLDRVMTERTEQAHTYTRSGTFMFFLNTELPPFDDVRVRSAVNYAVDRERMVELSRSRRRSPRARSCRPGSRGTGRTARTPWTRTRPARGRRPTWRRRRSWSRPRGPRGWRSRSGGSRRSNGSSRTSSRCSRTWAIAPGWN